MTRTLTLLLAATVMLAAPASAQLMGAKELKTAVPAKGFPGTKPVADVYYLVGEVGAKEAYTFTGKGPASLTLFGPDGSEILTSSGSGTVKLEVVLPFTDVFTLAVARKTPAQPYVLARKATVPTLAEAELAKGVGYERDHESPCWIIPGVKVKIIYSNGDFREDTLAADRTTVSWVNSKYSGDRTFSLDGSELHRMSRARNGNVTDTSHPIGYAYNPEEFVRFTRYQCTG